MHGEVTPDVVTSAMGWFSPDTVAAMYAEGAGVAGARGAAARMAVEHAKWGDTYYAGVDGLNEAVAVSEELVNGLEGSAIPALRRVAPGAEERDGGGPGGAAHADAA